MSSQPQAEAVLMREGLAGQLVEAWAGLPVSVGRSLSQQGDLFDPDEFQPDQLYHGMRRVPCEWCGAEAAEGSTCPWSLGCPSCEAKPGTPCKRPSGHYADRMHAARWEAAEAVDQAQWRAIDRSRHSKAARDWERFPDTCGPDAWSGGSEVCL